MTLKIADKRDLWLHTKEIAGSHVFVRLGGNEISDVALEQAATLAALHSKGSASRQVHVDYTNVKYVKKPAGAKPGMVYIPPIELIMQTPKMMQYWKTLKKSQINKKLDKSTVICYL